MKWSRTNRTEGYFYCKRKVLGRGNPVCCLSSDVGHGVKKYIVLDELRTSSIEFFHLYSHIMTTI